MSLIDLYPVNYRESPELCAMQREFGQQTETMWALFNSFTRQLFLPTATWGLEVWERVFSVQTIRADPPETRRARVVAKMQGRGTITEQAIKELAESFFKTSVAFIGYPREYRYELKVTGVKGEPPGAEKLKEMLEELQPAHIGCGLSFTYNLHWKLGMYTHAMLGGLSQRKVREGSLPDWVTHEALTSRLQGSLQLFTHSKMRINIMTGENAR